MMGCKLVDRLYPGVRILCWDPVLGSVLGSHEIRWAGFGQQCLASAKDMTIPKESGCSIESAGARADAVPAPGGLLPAS